MLVLVRLLPAEVYGQFGFVTTLLGFLTLFSFREFLGYTLVVRDPGQVHYQDIFTAGAALQVGVCLVANLVALGLRWVPAYAETAPVLHVMSLLFLLDLPSELRVRMLERALDWRRLRVLHALALIASGALSVAMALRGWAVYALLVTTLVVPVVFGWDLWFRARWRPTWQWSWMRFKPAWAYGTSRISAVSFVSVAGLLEASWLSAVGFAAFGVFGRAVGLGQLLCGRVAGLLAQAVFPVLARIPPRSESYRRASAVYLRGVAWLVAPLAAVAALLADPVVRLLYGSDWLDVVPLLPWAMAAAALMAVVQTGYALLLAHQQQRRCLVADVWRLAGTVIALAALAGAGLRFYLVGMSAVHVVSLVFVLYWLQDDKAVTRRALVSAILPPVIATTAAVSAVLAVRTTGLGGMSLTTAAVTEGVVLALVYVLVLRLLFADAMEELIRALPERRRISRLLLFERAV
jgi:O-antigen/teichoic acid export membrane protein